MMRKLLSLIALTIATAAYAQEGYGVVDISVCNMRDNPNYSAEMVSQALLGTPVKILGHGGSYGWPQVETPDGYQGWVHIAAIAPMTEEEFHAWNAAPQIVVTAMTGIVYRGPSKRSGVVSDLVQGDRLKLTGRTAAFWKVEFPSGRTGYVSKADAKPLDEWRKGISATADAIVETALSMNGFPYIWAGMSPKGMDCSGFVRTVFWAHDFILPRDSGPQSKVGERIEGISALEKGDLVFFGRWDGTTPRVSHVGIYIGDGRFIHCLGLVKIGSFNADDPLYDAFNTGRYLFGGRILPYLSTDTQVSTSLSNPMYR